MSAKMSLVQSLFCLFELRQAFCVLSAAIFLYFAAAACTAHQKLQHVPGPRLASWTELWLLKVAWRGNFHLVADRLFREFGKSEIADVTHDLMADLLWQAHLSELGQT